MHIGWNLSSKAKGPTKPVYRSDRVGSISRVIFVEQGVSNSLWLCLVKRHELLPFFVQNPDGPKKVNLFNVLSGE